MFGVTSVEDTLLQQLKYFVSQNHVLCYIIICRVYIPSSSR
jgi:hypothetical protein